VAIKTSRLITIFGTKGGVGKSVIAANLSIALKEKQVNQTVVLVDLNLQVSGDIARMVGLKPRRSIVDLISNLERLERGDRSLSDFLTRHSSGIDILPAILRPPQAHLIDVRALERVFNLLRQQYDYLIIDAGNLFSDQLITALDNANLILLVVTPDVLSVYQTKWSVEIIESLHFPPKMIKMVLNRSESKGGVDQQEVKNALPCGIIAGIPSEGKVVGPSVNEGTPFVLGYKRAKVTGAINKLADSLVNNPGIYMAQQRGLRARLTEMRTDKKTFWQQFGMAEKIAREEMVKEDEIIKLKERVHKQFIEELNLKKVDLRVVSSDPQKARELRAKTEKIISRLLAQQAGGMISSYEVRNAIVKELVDDVLGLGPLEDLIQDPTISDILVNSKDQIYVERRGKLELTNKRFISNDHIRIVVERIIGPLGRRVDESIPMVDARLPDGSRVNVIIPPLALAGPMISIRKFSRGRYTIDDLLAFGSITKEMATFLAACVKSRKNMIISGGTGSGKTTLLNIVSRYIPENERIITIEDSAELQLHQEHWGRLEARMPNIEGKGAVTIRALFRNSLRMRPDRIIVGECRGDEAVDMLQAMNTGHDGSLTTIHANSPRDAVSRLDSMVLMSDVALPIRAIREMISSAIHLAIHTARLSDGSRKVMCISEIVGLDKGFEVLIKNIYVFEIESILKDGTVKGSFKFTGYIPSFIEELRLRSLELPPELQAKPA
jgi:pilus assembly protein CpaF